MPGYGSRLSAARSVVFVSSLGRTYDSWHRIIFIYQGHTIEERWTSIVVTVKLLSSIRVGPLLIHVDTLVDRCSWYMRQHKSVYDTASGTLASYATLEETTTHAGLCAGIG